MKKQEMKKNEEFFVCLKSPQNNQTFKKKYINTIYYAIPIHADVQ